MRMTSRIVLGQRNPSRTFCSMLVRVPFSLLSRTYSMNSMKRSRYVIRTVQASACDYQLLWMNRTYETATGMSRQLLPAPTVGLASFLGGGGDDV